MKSSSFHTFYCSIVLPILFTSTIIILTSVESVYSLPTASRFEFQSEEIPVHVELVNRKRVRRHISPVSTMPDFEYHLKISSESDHSRPSLSYDLKLQPLSHSVFSSAFKYTEFDEDDAGNPVTRSFVPSRGELDLIESKLYNEKDTHSFVKLEHDDDGGLELYGVVDGARIRTRRDAVTGKNSFSMKHPTRMESEDVSPPELGPGDMDDEDDEPEVPPDVAVLSRRSGGPLDLDAWLNLEPELAIVLEYHLAQEIGGDRNRKLEYAAITVNGINGFYELTNDSLRIRCELVNVVEIKKESRQKFLTKLKGKRYEMGEGRWTMEYEGRDLNKAYKKWAFSNAKKIGKYDIAPLLIGLKFAGHMNGRAPSPGACIFNTTSGSLATPITKDIGANFEGIQTMAHEIGHSIGSPHDGEPAKKTKWFNQRSTKECPFEYGFLMGYNRKNYTNSFRFSKCSLYSIKDYATLDLAACLRPDHKTGRPIIYTSEREAGNVDVNPFNRDKVCSLRPELNFQGFSAYQTPDKDCRLVKCEAKMGDKNKFSFSSKVPGRYTPCGDNQRKGKCRNGWCIGQGPAVDMHSICKIVTRFEGSEFDSESTPLDQICSSTSWSCSDAQNKVITKKFVVVPGTPCGGAKVCFNKECVEKDQITDPNKECILQTGKQEATQVEFKHPDPKCAGLIKCTFGTEFELIGPASTDPDCNPFAAIPDSLVLASRTPDIDDQEDSQESKDAESKKPITLQDVCDKEMEETGTSVKNQPTPETRDELCSNLICMSDGVELPIKGNTPDGVICGPLRRCKDGKCARCTVGRK